MQYPGWLKDTTGKELWSGESDEVSKGNRDVWRNIKWTIADKIRMPRAALMTLTLGKLNNNYNYY